MKKFLIASTALVALSGAAAAEITFSGDAQIGLKYDNRLWDADALDTRSGWNVQSRARFTVTMTGETDTGLSFGAKLRPTSANHKSYDKESRDTFSGNTTVWIEGVYGKLTVGDVDSAIEQAIGDLVQLGNSGLEFYNEMFYLATDTFEAHDNKGVVYSYQYGDATFFASFEDRYVAYSGTEYDGNSWSLGASYDVQQYSFGIGYSSGQDFGDGKFNSWGLMASGTFNDLTVKGLYIEGKDDDDKLKQYGISGDYTMVNGVGVQGFYRVNDWDDTAGKEKILGLGASYDLGGGASVNGGVVHIRDNEGLPTTEKRTIADVGVAFKF